MAAAHSARRVRVNDTDRRCASERRATAAGRAGASRRAPIPPSSLSGRRRGERHDAAAVAIRRWRTSRSAPPRPCPAPTRPGIAAGKRSPSDLTAASTPSGSITASSRSDTAMATSHHDHKRAGDSRDRLKPDGVAMAQKSKLYFASLDGTAAPRAVTGGVCYCCKTALAVPADGSIYAAGVTSIPATFATWRSRCRATAAALSPRRSGSARTSGCSKAVRTMARRWRSMRSERIHIVWPTLVSRRARRRAGRDHRAVLRDVHRRQALHSARADSDRGPAASPADRHRRRRIADGGVGRARQRVEARRLCACESGANGVPGFRRQLLTSDGPSVYPVVAAAGADVIVAWTSGTSAAASIRIERISGSGEGR